MNWRTDNPSSTAVTVAGLVSVGSLLITAASGLWLDLIYSPDASQAWDDIGALQDDIASGLFADNVRRTWGLIALMATATWLVVALIVRRLQLVLAVAIALAASAAAWVLDGDSSVIGPSILECFALAVGIAAVIYWHTTAEPLAPAESDRARSA